MQIIEQVSCKCSLAGTYLSFDNANVNPIEVLLSIVVGDIVTDSPQRPIEANCTNFLTQLCVPVI